MLCWRLTTCLVSSLWLFLSAEGSNISWQTWGPYRPNLYFGIRPQVPRTLLMGLMWAGGEDQNRIASSKFKFIVTTNRSYLILGDEIFISSPPPSSPMCLSQLPYLPVRWVPTYQSRQLVLST